METKGFLHFEIIFIRYKDVLRLYTSNRLNAIKYQTEKTICFKDSGISSYSRVTRHPHDLEALLIMTLSHELQNVQLMLV